MKIGYARVSSYGQSLEVQRQKLKDEGCSEIFEEKISALSQKRTELDNALRTIREGDVLIVTKLDGSAKGGVLVGLADQFKLPVHAIGVGEGIGDLRPFKAVDYARSLMGLDS